MTRPPRSPRERLFGIRSLAVSLLQGASVLAIVLTVFLTARWRGHSEDNARGLTFAALVVANLGLILTNRSWSRTIPAMMKEPNSALWWVIGGATVFLAMVIYVPVLRDLFHFAPLHLIDLAICVLVGGLSVLWFECVKVFRTRTRRM
jgi:Ca2+-transporting ATPase